jgi:HK97 family phage prohead protease
MLTERRILTTELRAVTVGGKRTIRGYAAKFGQPTSERMTKSLGFVERCAPGCFKRSIVSGADVVCLRDHKSELLMGRTGNRTLRLKEDGVGLGFECDLPNTNAADDLYTLIQRGDINGCSFQFVPLKQTWGKEKNSAGDWQASRTLNDVDLLDVSAVTMPAYDNTTVEANSLQEVERSLFPNGVPAEVRSRLNAMGINLPLVTQADVDRMRVQVTLALLD